MRDKRLLLARARKTAGFTQEELAYRLGVDRSTVGRWEAGETEPLPWLRPKLATLLGITRRELAKLILEAEKDPQAGEARGESDRDEQHHVAAALGDARRYFDGSVVDYFRQRLESCMTDDGTHGPIKTLPAVLGILGAITQIAREVHSISCGSYSLLVHVGLSSQVGSTVICIIQNVPRSGTAALLSGHRSR